MVHRIEITPDASDLRIGIALSQYHGWATSRMLEGAIERWKRCSGTDDALIVAPASGTWELTVISRALAHRGDLDGVVALGVVIRGETPHFEYICEGVTQGLTAITIDTGLPVGFGVLTCETTEQVEARTGGDIGNKGADAMSAVIEAALTRRELEHMDTRAHGADRGGR